MNLHKILTFWPIPNLLDFSLIQNLIFEGALVTDNGGIQSSKDEFLS